MVTTSSGSDYYLEFIVERHIKKSVQYVLVVCHRIEYSNLNFRKMTKNKSN